MGEQPNILTIRDKESCKLAAIRGMEGANNALDVMVATIVILACKEDRVVSPVVNFYHQMESDFIRSMRGKYDLTGPFVSSIRNRMIEVVNKTKRYLGESISNDEITIWAEILTCDIITLSLMRDEWQARRARIASEERICNEAKVKVERNFKFREWVLPDNCTSDIIYAVGKIIFKVQRAVCEFPVRSLLQGLLTSLPLSDFSVKSSFFGLNFGTLVSVEPFEVSSFHVVDVQREVFESFLAETAKAAVIRKYLPKMDYEQAKMIIRWLIEQVRLVPVSLTPSIKYKQPTTNSDNRAQKSLLSG